MRPDAKADDHKSRDQNVARPHAASDTTTGAPWSTAAEHEPVGRERLLDEGMRLFLDHGYAAVSTRQICGAAGVTQPSLYHHFGSKDGIYFAVLLRWFDLALEEIEKAIARASDLTGRLHRVAVIFWSGQFGDYQAMQHDAIQVLPHTRLASLGATVNRAIIAPVVQIMEDAILSGELPVDAHAGGLTHLFWALVDGIASAYRRNRAALPEPEANSAPIHLFVAGARAMEQAAFAAWPERPIDRPAPPLA
ncbi:MAG TPA: TetR/AcrR family transcriptional regulator [Ktedonobacterales bacterium]